VTAPDVRNELEYQESQEQEYGEEEKWNIKKREKNHHV